jgi:serine/threonine protein kinase
MTEQSTPSVGQAGPLRRGDVVAGKYRVEETAGEGGMAIVYAAHHLVLDQRVAVKVLVADGARDEVTTERFVREAQAAARLQSEHAVRVMDAGVLSSGQPYLVMEFLEGCDLAELVELSGPIEVPEFTDYMLQALEGIAHAHAAGIVHRDVKPSNLFLALRPDGSNAIKVLDFGISKSTVEASGADVTKLTGKAVLGSPAYMSPEQVRNASSVDARSDVWSLGVSMYELLTGRMPFEGEGVGAMLAAILEADAVPVHELRPQVPEALSNAVMRCLRRNRDERWADVGELAAALAPFGTGARAALPESIAATLAHAAKLRRPTPLGAFPVTSLAALVASSDVDASVTPPPSMRKAAAVDGARHAAAYAATLEQPQSTVVTHSTRRKGGLSRLAFLMTALGTGAIILLVATRGANAPAAAPSAASPALASPTPPPQPPPSADVPPALPSAAVPPAPPPASVALPTSPMPSTSVSAAAATRRPQRRWGSPAPPSMGSTRPSILHSRN